ncbi:MAG: chemotaxis protein CheX [Planctomycetes bacterium RBG_13_63_9]|nr:MAG: chemotaxis protein CheX [Planctomycetes bacterium RBG_13_63_9]
MQAEYINPFITSLRNTFQTMLGCEVHRGKLALASDSYPTHEISGIIGLSGKAVGTVVLSLSEALALKAASTMLMCEITAMDDDVADAVGELTNMVAGAAKATLEQYELRVSLPNVITGRGHVVRFPSEVSPISVPFESDWGDLALKVGLAPVREPVTA